MDIDWKQINEEIDYLTKRKLAFFLPPQENRMSTDKPEEGGMEKYGVVNSEKEKTARDEHELRLRQKALDKNKKEDKPNG